MTRLPIRLDGLGGRVCTIHGEHLETRGDAIRIRNGWGILHTGPAPRIGYCDATQSWHVIPPRPTPRRRTR
ncbi:hypothetical protein LX16_2834 [Stackebrandtia albiflava]|uniref:Uncharacterized protein n=1 Tax=Stackebrandtia albiflava TaxID=406432 RepID=A0A562V2H7_9ACTN|nr:hypothetical protein [Stackebrandtia albiflava]TWJ12086.1 hypothetical protein LX16_2834 [Stackebrandtia albiflava]